VILVTGGAGYLGNALVPRLLALGHSVRVVDTFWYGNALEAHPRLECLTGDVRHPVSAWLNDVTVVIHLGGISTDPAAHFLVEMTTDVNAQGTRRLAEVAAEHADRAGRPLQFLFASSTSVYYLPTGSVDLNVRPMTEDTSVAPPPGYGESKRLAETALLELAQRHPLFSPVILRKATLFGVSRRMRFDLTVNAFTLEAWRQRALLVRGRGEVWRPLLHVDDAVDAYLRLLEGPADVARGEIFNIVHRNCRVVELAHEVAEVLERQRNVSISVRRDPSIDDGRRSYYVPGEKSAEILGVRPQRPIAGAVLALWDQLEAGVYGPRPQDDPLHFNIVRLRQVAPEGTRV
jgi:nucleoside-diphosphate-sugar epimerase